MIRKLLKNVVLPALLGVCACSDDNTSGVSVEDNAVTANGSCSSDVSLSSSAIISSSSSGISGLGESSSSGGTAGIYKNDLWNGSTGNAKINTGSENSGYWYTWGDGAYGGTSKIVFPVAIGNEYSAGVLDPVIDHCGGLCGTIEFGKTANSEVGVGFSVAEEGKTADISSWGGLCISYSSEVGFYVYLLSELGNASNLNSNPRIEFDALKKSKKPVTSNFLDPMSPMTKCAKWENFSVLSDDYSVVRSGDGDAKKAKAIVFKFSGTPGAQYAFNIKSVGTYDERLPDRNQDTEGFYNGIRITDEDSATCVWKGPLYERFETEDAAGTWFTYGDEIGSKIVYPVDLGYYSWQSVWGFDPLLDYCGGFCATMGFDRYEDGDMFLGVGLVFAGREIEENCGDEECFDRLKTADIEDWGGVCITYYSEKDAYLKLGIDVSYYEDMTSNDFPFVQIPKSTTMAERCYKWSDFDKMSSEKLKKVSTIAFEVRSETNHEQAMFNVAAVGKYSAQGSCSLKASSKPYVLPESSASVSPAVSSSSMSSSSVSSSSWSFQDECGFQDIDDLWYGPDGCYRVETYLGDDTETSGYWFAIEDSSAGKSKLVWPVSIGNEYADDAKDSIIDYCAGICAKIEFGKEYFAGVGFNVRGVVEGEGVSLADATEWGGLCVTYASEADIDIVMNNNDRDVFGDLYKFPKATIPKSKGVITKCVDWSDFKTIDGLQGDPTKVGRIYFVINGKANTTSKFNILGLGKYKNIGSSVANCSSKDNFVLAD